MGYKTIALHPETYRELLRVKRGLEELYLERTTWDDVVRHLLEIRERCLNGRKEER